MPISFRGTTNKLLNLRKGEGWLVVSLLAVLGINAAVLELSDVVATAGFISNLGAQKVPVLWIVDMAVALLAATIFARYIDRMPRLRLLVWMIGGLALLYLALLFLFRAGLPDWVTYPSLYIIADQQFMLFPLVFWTLVSDVFTLAQAKRLIPVIGVGMALGSVVGNLLPAYAATIIARYGGDNSYLFVLSIILLVLSLVILLVSFRKRAIRARQSGSSEGDLHQLLRVTSDYFRNLPVLHYLTLTLLLVGLALTVIEFNFLYMIDVTFTTDLAFQSFYGIYKAILIVALVLFQGLISGRLLEKISLKNGYPVLPITMLSASGLAMLLPNLAGAAAGRFAARFVERAWDEPVREATLSMVPDERRGRVSAFLETYIYAVATIVGSVILIVSFWLGTRYSSFNVVVGYLLVAAVASTGAIWAAVRARASYDESLLNWRLSRSRRKSALDGIEF